jgi:hypothetical protein
MAQLSMLSNRISEIQEKNLKHYPFVFFNDVKSVKIEYNLSRWDNEQSNGLERHVTYSLELDETNQAHLDKRFFCIEEATRVLFWSDLKVRVVINGKLAYESKEDVRNPASKKA